jgi:hypothetical protein
LLGSNLLTSQEARRRLAHQSTHRLLRRRRTDVGIEPDGISVNVPDPFAYDGLGNALGQRRGDEGVAESMEMTRQPQALEDPEKSAL